MPNLTTPFLDFKGDSTDDKLNEIQKWSVSLIDELKYILCNLDAGNVTEAGKVKSQNIDCSNARIKDAQIQNLTADKLTAGTIDAQGITSEKINVINLIADNITTGKLNSGLVTVENSDAYGKSTLSGDALMFTKKVSIDGKIEEVPRIIIGRTFVLDDETGEGEYKYVFKVISKDGTQGIYMNEDGNISITGNIEGASNINVTEDIRVGRRLILHNADGTEAAAISVGKNELLEINAMNNRNINVYSDGNVNINGHNINLNTQNGGKCYCNGIEIG